MEPINTCLNISFQNFEIDPLIQELLSLPPELIPQILSHVPSKDVAVNSLVCRSFKTLIMNKNRCFLHFYEGLEYDTETLIHGIFVR